MAQFFHINYANELKAAMKRIVNFHGEIPYEIETDDAMFKRLYSDYQNHKISNYCNWFLRTIVPKKSITSGEIKLMSISDMISYKHDVAPFCNSNNHCGLIPLADWTGHSDGDVWVYDLNDDSICSLGLGADMESYNDAKRSLYLKFDDVFDWVKYLFGCHAYYR